MGGALGNVFAHTDNVTMTTSWERPQQLTVCLRSQELLPSLVSGCQVMLVVSTARCSGIVLMALTVAEQPKLEPEEVRQEVKARGGAIIKIKFAREISDGMLWNV